MMHNPCVTDLQRLLAGTRRKPTLMIPRPLGRSGETWILGKAACNQLHVIFFNQVTSPLAIRITCSGIGSPRCLFLDG